MQKALSLKWLYIATILVGVFLLVFFMFESKQGNTSLSQNSDIVSSILTNPNLPISIQIPKISVDSVVEYVGLTAEGLMDAPKGPENVGWFHLGTVPGEIGSAVMDGHFGWKNGIPAVFDNLDTLAIGDKIQVKNAKGEVTTFVVRKISIFNPNADASSVFTSSDGIAHLNLITCAGKWEETKQSHSERLVVFSDRE